MENVVGRRLALLAGWGAVLFYLLDSRSAISAAHTPTFFLLGVLLGPFCAWGAMFAADYEEPSARKTKLSRALELLSAAALAFFLVAFALSWIGVPGL
ncbi:MAG: hypothetical protein AB7L26_05460 [Hyphomonadaceae bacterium]